MKRRAFIKSGLLFVPTISIFVPRLVRAQGNALRDPALFGLYARGPAAASYPIIETFENATGYDLAGWNTTGTGTNPNFSTAGISMGGSECCLFDPGASATLSRAIPLPPANEIWFKLRFRTKDAFQVGTTSRITLYSDTTVCGDISVSGSQMKVFLTHGTQATGFETNAQVVDTTYFYWARWKISGGTDGVFQWYRDTTDTRPGSPTINQSNGNGMLTPNKFTIQAENPQDFVVDDIKLDIADFT